MTTEERAKELPEKIWFEEKSGTNGYHCLDYPNWDDSVMYIRSDFAKQETAELVKIVADRNLEIMQLRQTIKELREAVKNSLPPLKNLFAMIEKGNEDYKLFNVNAFFNDLNKILNKHS